MNKPTQAGMFVTADKQNPFQMQTLSPRDFLNKNYIYRYEDVVEQVTIRMADKEQFFDNLSKLYWSFIAPREYTLTKAEREELCADVFAEKDIQKGLLLLKAIGKKMHLMGISRPEKKESDVDHIIMEELE